MVRELDGRPLVLMWATPAEGSGPEDGEDVLRAETADGAITHLPWYYFCPDVLTALGARLDVPVRTHSHTM
ncbi:hypothetical protein AB0G79_14550 [Streptomyces sp. NPDC020807]|uniref:hypothetical protein n=1 Tax=Streptomyces sp. NPDC020807 TaxID=3155119 RepID=UPI00340562CD